MKVGSRDFDQPVITSRPPKIDSFERLFLPGPSFELDDGFSTLTMAYTTVRRETVSMEIYEMTYRT
jgi:hypothetical protein